MKELKMKYLPVSLLLFLLSGCVTFYQPPPNAPTATLKIRGEGNILRVVAFADDRCKRFPNGSRLAYFFHESADPKAGVEKPIEANVKFYFGYIHEGCSVSKYFVPEAGKYYEANHIANYNGLLKASSNSCDFSLEEVSHDESGNEKRIAVVGLSPITPPCMLRATD
jgi:hypothetical protein